MVAYTDILSPLGDRAARASDARAKQKPARAGL
jgi:hypothetical protein